MLKLGFMTGTAWLKEVIVEGSINDDLMAIIEEHVQSHKEDFRTYEYEEALQYSNGDELLMDAEYMPINGGEYYIDMIITCKEI